MNQSSSAHCPLFVGNAAVFMIIWSDVTGGPLAQLGGLLPLALVSKGPEAPGAEYVLAGADFVLCDFADYSPLDNKVGPSRPRSP